MDRNAAFEEMARMSTALISDAMFRLGHKDRTMRSRIKPVHPGMRVAGPACTAQGYPGATYASSLALEAARPGEVIVIDAQGYLEAIMWGEIFSTMAMAKGVRGTIVDGAVRDIAEVIELGYPLFGAGISPAAGTSDQLGKVSLPIQCGGVVVRPGDYVFGDLLGVVVVPTEELLIVHEKCLEVAAKEAAILEKLRAQRRGE